MSVVWAVLLLLPPVLAVGLLAHRLHRTRAGAARVEARLAAVLAAAGSGLSVWTTAGSLVACNARFRELYPDVPLKPGLELEDLLRFTVTRGLVQVPDVETEAWVQARLAGVGEGARTVVRTAAGGWLEIRAAPVDGGETLLLYTDVTDAEEVRGESAERKRQLAARDRRPGAAARRARRGGRRRAARSGCRAGRGPRLRLGGLAGRARLAGRGQRSAASASRCLRRCRQAARITKRCGRCSRTSRPQTRTVWRCARRAPAVSSGWRTSRGIRRSRAAGRPALPGIRGACAVPVRSGGRGGCGPGVPVVRTARPGGAGDAPARERGADAGCGRGPPDDRQNRGGRLMLKPAGR